MNLEKYFDTLSPGFVIEIYKDGEDKEIVSGNKEVVPEVKETTSDTLYDIASLTKMFTGGLIYKAYEEHIIDLDDTIYNIDNHFDSLKDVTILDLLSHNQDIWTKGYLGDVKSKEEFYNILYTAYVKNNVPTYVDTHYIILACLLETIYKKSFETLCIENIIKPLNMDNTYFNPDPSRCASNNYEHAGEKTVDYIYPGLIHDTKGRIAHQYGLNLGHASIFTTGKDMMIFLKTFLNNKLLKKETIEFMLQHRNTNENNYKLLKDNYNGDNINDLYKEHLLNKKDVTLSRTYNNMGARYKNDIDVLNDVPINASSNSITFSGYTGPMFTIDFDNKIIVLIMCNIIHNTNLNRTERKALMVELMNNIFDSI